MPTMMISYTVQEVQRMSHCFGKSLNLGRDATQEDVRQATMAWQKNTVFTVEHQEATDNAINSVPPPDPFNPT